jgi:hypothetical protein
MVAGAEPGTVGLSEQPRRNDLRAGKDVSDY